MQHDHALKKLNVDLLTPIPGSGDLWAEYMLPCCRICGSLYFDMPHDHVLKKLNFDLLTPSPRVLGGAGSAGKILVTMLLHFMIPFSFIRNMTMI